MKFISIIFIITLFLVVPINADVVINEIMYNPAENENYNEWIEIYNNGNEEIDLIEWTLCGTELLGGYVNHEDEEIYLDITTVLEPNQYALITDGGSGTDVYENFEVNEDSIALHVDAASLCGGLSNAGEIITMENNEEITDEVEYSNEWGNGEEGFSLELINPTLDNNIGGNWSSSENEGGTPGEQNSIFEEVEEILEQVIELKEGWNLISSYIIPNNLDINVIFDPLVQEGVLRLVKDEEGRFFNPVVPFNNIPEWNPEEAYYVRVIEDTPFIIQGTDYVNLEIELHEGWNHIVYPLQVTHDMEEIIEQVLDPLGDSFSMIKNGKGRFYFRDLFNNIPEMIPGEGYQIKVTEDLTIDFNQIG